MKARVAIVGEYDGSVPAHKETVPALKHSAAYISVDVDVVWVPTTEAAAGVIADVDGILMAAGPAYQNFEGSLAILRTAREQNFPCLATCRGFQHMVVEFARNVVGLEDAGHEDYCPAAATLAITPTKIGRRATKRTIDIVEGSRLAPMYYSSAPIERFYGVYGVNPAIEGDLARHGFVSMASDRFGAYRVGGLPRHQFYFGSLFVPQLRATRLSPHPLITAFLKTCVVKRRFGLPKSS